jgi:pSer/pThr/pTyr-binding forkhead associated (FHA) protein
LEVYISILNSSGERKVLKLPDFPIRIGRTDDNHITVPDDLCSSKHLMISKTQDSVLIKDLNSKNGVVLNGIKILSQKMYIGDSVKIGSTEIKIYKEKLCERALSLLEPKSRDRHQGDITIELELPRQNIKRNAPSAIKIQDDKELDSNEKGIGKIKSLLNFLRSK